jgi:translation initiation factor 1
VAWLLEAALFVYFTGMSSGAHSPASRLVYSTDTGRVIPASAPSALPVGDGVVRVSRQTKGRGGKAVTVVLGATARHGQMLDAQALLALGKQLKTACGSGGTVKEGVIEVQGDHVDKVMATLIAQGFVVKRAGG